ncbi:efflux RND transporter periplasmic adaptor subunit [bacterium]|nr:efflux RND transporter periplasmic adaptor subunit [bacterium]
MASRLLQAARSNVPTVVVFLGLGALAFAGHRSGWKVPKLAEIRARSSPPKEDWCPAHNVPDSRCLACHPELGGNDAKDWCREHGVPESKCTVCHPEILTKGQAADFCREHGVPESCCTLCHPEIVVKGTAPPNDSPFRSVLDPAAKRADPSACQSHLVRIQFAGAASVKKAGVKLASVEERPIAASVSANAESSYDQTRVARLSARAAGTVFRVEKDTGARVSRGEVLALVESAEVGKAKSDLLQAFAAVDLKTKTLARIRGSAGMGLRTQGELEEAEAALRDARVRIFQAHQALSNLGLAVSLEKLASLPEEKLASGLRLAGIPESVAKTLDGETASANLLPIVAPLDGEVVAREVVAGEVVDPSKCLFVVADLARMWIDASVRLEDGGSLAPGQRVFFRPEGDVGPVVTGTVVWMSPAVDEKTRTLRVRAEVGNGDRQLRSGVFGSARIVVREAARAIVVPNEAIHFEGCCHVVFVRLTDDIFQTRKVRLGARAGGFTEVLVGVAPGEVIATQGSHVLKAELLKGKLGAGCCD